MGKYWLVKCPNDDGVTDTVMRLLESLRGLDKAHGVEVVQIIPEHRSSNWMERALAAQLTEGSK